MKVRATKLGYYDMLKRYPGDIFELKEVKGLTEFEGKPRVLSVDQQFSSRWMEKIESKIDSSESEKPVPKGRTRAQVARSESSSGDVDVI